MGEVIKKIAKLPNGLEIELNAPQSDGKDFIIHIQNEYGRMALSRNEFIQLAMLFYSAECNLKTYKILEKQDEK